MIAENLARNQEKLKQLVDRFESLMDEGRYMAADELGSTEIPEAGPNAPVSASTSMVAHLVGLARPTWPSGRLAARPWSTRWPRLKFRSSPSRTTSPWSIPMPRCGKS